MTELLPSFDLIVTSVGSVKAATQGYLINDLEPPAFVCEPKLMALKQDIAQYLLEGGEGGVMMSGSGELFFTTHHNYALSYHLGTSVYALMSRSADESERQRRQASVKTVLEKHTGVRHFQCSYLRKSDDEKHWYTI